MNEQIWKMHKMICLIHDKLEILKKKPCCIGYIEYFRNIILYNIYKQQKYFENNFEFSHV